MAEHTEDSGCQCPACYKDVGDRKVIEASFRSGNADVTDVLEEALRETKATECVVLLQYPSEPFYRILHTECPIERLVGRIELIKHEMLNYKSGVTE
jgi:hypothetical protein